MKPGTAGAQPDSSSAAISMAKRRLFICYFLSRGDCAASNQRSFITGTHSLPQSLRWKTEKAKPENRRSRQARLAAAAHAETRSYDGFGADNCCKETGVYARGGGVYSTRIAGIVVGR